MNNYTVSEILFAIKNKSTLEDRAAITGCYDILDVVVDADRIVNNCGLTDRQRQIFNMYYVQDFTLAMIGNALEISHQGVADALAQCRRKIKRYIEGGDNGARL